jgi:hypothetical protein
MIRDLLVSAMARGIHLKQLRTADLEAIGVPDDGLPETVGGESPGRINLLAEADPVLAQAIVEVRQGLEATLQFLDEALSADSASQSLPAASDKTSP